MKYKVVRSSFGTISAVHVFTPAGIESFNTLKEAKQFIKLYNASQLLASGTDRYKAQKGYSIMSIEVKNILTLNESYIFDDGLGHVKVVFI